MTRTPHTIASLPATLIVRPLTLAALCLASPTALAGTYTFDVSSDTYVRSNMGTCDSCTFLYTFDNGPNIWNKRQLLIQFEPFVGMLPGQIPPGSTIDSAVVRLKTYALSHDPSTNYVHRMLISWPEDITWNAAYLGSDGVQADDVEAAVAETSVFVTDGSERWFEFDVAGDVQAMIDGAVPNLGWMIQGITMPPTAFYSSEYSIVADRPVLVVNATPPPCDGDADGDGAVDVNDISYVIFRLGNSGVPGEVDGDADANGVVDVNDISYVIFRLGSC